MLTIDFETYYTKEYSLSKMTTESYIRDPRFQVIGVSVKVDNGPIEWITGTHEEIKERLQAYDFTQTLAHNAVFDGAILSWVFDIHPKTFFDTLSMSRPLTGATVGGSLRALSEEFNLGHKGEEIYNTIGKRREDFTDDELARFGEYCRQDVNLTYKLFFKLLPAVTRQELYFIDMFIKMFTEPKIVLDKARLEAHLADVRAKKEALLAKVTVDKSELMSNPKFALLLQQHGVSPPMKISPATGKETYAFSKTDLEFKALLEHPDEQVQALVAARFGLRSTIEETRTENLIGVAERGPLPILLNYWGAGTGRSSGGDGLNLQNLPRGGEIRKSLCASPGYVIVACDSSNIEARMNAWFCQQADMVQEFRENRDVYSSFASTIFGKPINKHDNPTERFIGKVGVLSLGYSAGGERFNLMLKTSANPMDLGVDRCKEIVYLYRKKYAQIAGMWRQCTQVLQSMASGQSGEFGSVLKMHYDPEHLYLPNGMNIYYPELHWSDEHEAFVYKRKKVWTKIFGAKFVENMIQALARIVVFNQMGAIDQVLKEMNKEDNGKRQVVLMVHDEVVVVVPRKDTEKVKTIMVAAMSKPPRWACGLPVSCEAGVGDNYGEAK